MVGPVKNRPPIQVRRQLSPGGEWFNRTVTFERPSDKARIVYLRALFKARSDSDAIRMAVRYVCGDQEIPGEEVAPK